MHLEEMHFFYTCTVLQKEDTILYTWRCVNIDGVEFLVKSLTPSKVTFFIVTGYNKTRATIIKKNGHRAHFSAIEHFVHLSSSLVYPRLGINFV